MSFFKNFIFIICAMLIFTTNAYTWSSADNFQGAFATHQFLNKKAYQAIRSHPAFNSSGFPSLDDIQRHGSVTITRKGVTGLGPDKEGNSYFSQHWYNPKNKQGKAPETIKKFHSNLTKALIRPTGNYTEEQARENKAHLAAYVAHYMQDMTCPMHVSGIDGINALRSKVGTLDDISPYAVSLYSKETWKIMINRFKEVRAKDPYTDFFDPLYYDGGWPATTKFGSHVQYEAKVEESYMAVAAATHQVLWAVEEKKGYIPEDYDRSKGKAKGEGMALLAKEAAKKTRDRIGTKSNPGPLWIDLDAIFASLQIPYEDWWRAIQLTYVTWRSSFCALHSATEDVKFVKISNRPKEYKLSVSVDNLEPEAPAKSVKIYYKIEGDIKTDGNIVFTEPIPKNDTSGWYSADKAFKIEDPKNLSGKITIEIKGKYDKKIPDSGFKRVEYDLKDITIEAIEMPNVFNHKQNSAAIQSLKTDLWAFNVTIESAGVPDSQNMEYRVKSQIPAPGEWVARGDNVVLKVYGKFPQDAPVVDNNSINQADTTKKDRIQTKKQCNETKNAATALTGKIQDNEKKFISFGDKLKKFFKKFKDLKKESKFVKTAHKDMEKKAVAIAEISHELEKLVLKICQTTKELNDHTKTDSEHDRNYDWINNKKERLKELLGSANNIIKDANSLDKESKKRLEAAKLLKNISQAALQKISQDIEALLETNFDESMDELNKKAAMLNTDDCPENVFVALRQATKHYQKNQDKLKQITTFYKAIKTDFDKKAKEVENLDQIYQKTAYLLDLSKAYVERAQNAAVKGAFCAVLAENIMKKVFIPDVRGIDINEAESRLVTKGLNVTRSELGTPSSTAEAGIVQKLAPGITKRVKKGTNVTLSYYDQRPDKESQLAELDCSQWPGSQEMVIFNTGERLCDCPSTKIWNADHTACIDKNIALPSYEEIKKAGQDFQLAQKDCSQFPGTEPVWDTQKDQAVCACKQGLVLNANKNGCITQQQAVFENMDCSQYPGTVPNYDNNGNLGCACPDGTQWIQSLNRCANQQDMAMANADCSQFPGTVSVWNAQNNSSECNCPFGTEWNPMMGKCINQQDLAMANADCSHLPGSAPTWSYITNQVECECQSPYSRDLMTGECVDWIAKAQRDNEAFNQEMENRRRRNQEQLQQSLDKFLQPYTPNRRDPYDGDSVPANKNNESNNLCNMLPGIKVIGVWSANGRWYSCLTGANLSMGKSKNADCPMSNWPPKGFQRSRCGPVMGRCVVRFTVKESKQYGGMGYLKAGEEICGYLY